ncbi:MAG TPA: alanine--tRNA ligase [Tenuifilaceae bacterium]|nr:alanine--tRNA ligase [Tenuifilaceae bacterium]HPI44128.1 alanine--tRNA ligase [Tenuifilaceae bacterium]HPN21351.1 alanine--tRNA ligase [Tenuifilaceae bacterium]
MNSIELRTAFLEFFKSKSHQIVPSAPMVIKNDPTLMFTNAGMNQFKDIFLGNSPVKYPRIANSQKCLRVSGKHNDLEEVGHDTYHHTMFEMLGNWSFGDYFKNEAIDWGWEFLIDVLKIDKERVYATVFEGSPNEGVEMDSEAKDRWKKYLPEERILLGNKKDNFWEMGDTGPCGPCTEIHVDIRSDEERKAIPGHKMVNTGHPQVIEIWNLVFIQYNRKANGTLEPLPAKHVDTGMGFERLAMVTQGKKSNYDTDVFTPIINRISQMCGIEYGKDQKADVAMRVIADHLRAISFSIADGQLPSNVKAGYVIRRILRRAVRYGYTFLNFREPFIDSLVPVLVEQMGNHFPELKAQKDLIINVINKEEAAFLHTLETGIRLLDQQIAKAKKEKLSEISGKEAFVLYDTYGFPLDLTELILRENDLGVNRKEFDAEMTTQKERSRADAAVEAHDWEEILDIDEVEFVGYDSLKADVRIAKMRTVKTKGTEQYHIVLDKTPFYAESGGQVGDSGTIEGDGEPINVINTFKENNLIIHLVDRLPSKPKAQFFAKVNVENRTSTANNHSATHLLHNALRKVLGTHVEQKGSLVGPDYLRFDFSHFQKMTDEEIRQVEKLVNRAIRQNITLDEHRDVPMEHAQQMGAMALFGEKYGDSVRVIRFGESVELCGGTHVHATGQIGMFKLTSEGAIAAGIRRIEAITGVKAEEFVYSQVETIKEIKTILGNPASVTQAANKLVEENEALRKEIEMFQAEKLKEIKSTLKQKVQQHDGINIISECVTVSNADAIKDLAFQLKNEVADLYLVLGAEIAGKAVLTIMISDKLVEARQLNASNIVREAAKEIQGGGGGQAFYATAGGKNPTGLESAIAKAVQIIK